MSTTARPVRPVHPLVSGARALWNQLTSMRTALLLLFALALAAIPGSLVPQRSVSPFQVRELQRTNPGIARVYDALGLFNVYSSPWFSAIYLLLFISLIGCILPRLATYVRSLRAEPPRTPTNLVRLPAHASEPLPVGRTAAATIDAAEAHLRAARYRVVRKPDGSLSAERGRLREAGNLLFHIALVFALVGMAIAGTFGYRGTALVVSPGAFSNTLTQYDEFTGGGRFDERHLEPFTVRVDEFRVEFERGDTNRGAPRQFEADVRVVAADGERKELLQVNHPVIVNGTAVHLLAHGYAANVTVVDGEGKTAFNGPVPFLPQDGNFSSKGVVKAPDARPSRLAFEGVFLPTAVVDQQGPHSLFPDALNPELFLNAWSGAPKQETGRPENVYQLDKTGMTQLKRPDGTPIAIRLKPGQGVDLPGGGSLTFNGYQRWVKLQVSKTPGAALTMVAIGLGTLGLCGSLFIKPRRLWLRVVEGDNGDELVEAAGLDRVDGRGGLEEDVRALLAAGLGKQIEEDA